MIPHHTRQSNESEIPTSGISTKTLVRILLAVGIGIPVLIESFTALELFHIHLFSNGKIEQHHEHPQYHVREGRQLLPELLPGLTLEHSRVWAEPQKWIFEMELEMEKTPAHPFELTLYKVVTTGKKKINDSQTISWKKNGRSGNAQDKFDLTWSLPPGETPLAISVILKTQISPDSTHVIKREIKFGKIPVQYRDDTEDD